MLLLISFSTSLLLAWLMVRYESSHKNLSGDYDTKGVQKFHKDTTPRIGGVAIFAGILSGFLSNYSIEISFLLAASLPVFMAGLLEDLTKKISPFVRLIAAFVAAGIAIYGLEIGLNGIGWAWVDANILSISAVSIVLTVFMIGGVSHATNIIDGFNGLLLGYSLLALSILLWVAFQVEDQFVINIILILLGAIVGLFFFNFPKARIFTGDGGAYLIGFLLAVISLLLVKNNSQVSPWMPLLVLVYPVFETLFSVYRRKRWHKSDSTQPDAGHLHSLIYRRVVRHRFPALKNKLGKNASASVIKWVFITPFMLPALFWWDNHFIMLAGIIVFCLVYIWLYFSIVRFGFAKKQ